MLSKRSARKVIVQDLSAFSVVCRAVRSPPGPLSGRTGGRYTPATYGSYISLSNAFKPPVTRIKLSVIITMQAPVCLFVLCAIISAGMYPNNTSFLIIFGKSASVFSMVKIQWISQGHFLWYNEIIVQQFLPHWIIY